MEQKRCMRAALALVLAGGLGISACASPAQSGDVGERFDAYMDDLFYEDIVLNTVNLHYTLAHPENYGITEYEVNYLWAIIPERRWKRATRIWRR